MEDVSKCPLCTGSNNVLFDKRKFNGIDVINRMCRNCGLVFQSPRMTEEESAEYYRAEYRRTYQGKEGPVERDKLVQRSRAESLVSFVVKRVDSISRCLDIGSSAGLTLKGFHEAFSCQTVGIEPGDAYREYATKLGLKIYPSLGMLEQAGENKFDMIIMSHVLEHLPSPVEYLTKLRDDLLTPNGWLLIEVPNLYAHDAFEPAHLLAFSPHTLKETLRMGGYRAIQFTRHGTPNSKIFPLYLRVLCQPDARIAHERPKAEPGVKFKRWSGLFCRRILEKLLPFLAWNKIS